MASKEEVSVRQGEVKAAEAGIAQAAGAVSTAEAGKLQADSALDEASTYLSYTKLIAPAAGVIKTKAAEVGELVGAGFPVFTIEKEKKDGPSFTFQKQRLRDYKLAILSNYK